MVSEKLTCRSGVDIGAKYTYRSLNTKSVIKNLRIRYKKIGNVLRSYEAVDLLVTLKFMSRILS